MSSPFADISGRCTCQCHTGPNRSGCTCTCPYASSSSTPIPQPISEKALVAVGRHLIRWRALTFYYDFMPQEQRKKIYGDTQTAAAIIRLELNRVNVVDTWKQYRAEMARAGASSPSSSTKSASSGEHSKGREQAFTRKIVRRFSPVHSSASSATLESAETRGSSSQNQNDRRSASSSENNRSNSRSSTPLRAIFDTAAARLQVSRNQLELAFKYYAFYLSSDRAKRITAKDVVREKRYSDLGEIVLLDVEEFSMLSHSASSSQVQFPSLGTNHQDRHPWFCASTASTTASLSSFEGDGDDTAENEVSPTSSVAMGAFCRANVIRRELLGKHHPSVTEAIAACTEHYFECLRYQEPRRLNRMYLWSLLTGRAKDKKRKGRAVAVAGSSGSSNGADAADDDSLLRRHQKDWRIVWRIRPSVAPKFHVEDLNGSIKLEKRPAGADL